MKKTHLVAIATVLYAICGVFIGAHDWSVAIPMILGAGGLSALRAGVAKSAIVPLFLAVLALGACASSVTPQQQTVPTDAKQRAGSDYRVSVAHGRSAASNDEAASLHATRESGEQAVIEVPMKGADGKPVFVSRYVRNLDGTIALDKDGQPLTEQVALVTRITSHGIGDVYVAHGNVDQHIEVQPAATATGTQSTTGSGDASKTDTVDQKPSGTITVPLTKP